MTARCKGFFRFVTACCILAVSAGLCFAQTSSVTSDYVFRPGDVISISIVGQPGESIPRLIIPEDGRISVFNKHIQAAGRTRAELEKELTEIASELIKNPIISVNLVETPHNRVFVTGAVGISGPISYVQGLTLRKAIAQAGGLKPTAGKTITLIRSSSEPVAIKIDLPALMMGDSSDVELLPGDYILVGEAVITVAGEVLRPGDQPYSSANTLLRAIANAGGLTLKADPRNVIIRRDGTEKARVDLTMVSKSTEAESNVSSEADFRLEPGDTVYVPEAVVQILGEVVKPGAYPFYGANTALKAVASAGGLLPTANQYRAVVQRDGKIAAYVDLSRVEETGSPAFDDTKDANFALQPGDILFVPPVRDSVHLEGAVNRPGRVFLIPKVRDKILDVLAMASGAHIAADLKRVELRRPTPEGKYIKMTLDLSPSGSPANNVIVKDGDYIYVPMKQVKTWNAITVINTVISIMSIAGVRF
jgi:protein involved in polysaccharide export with SLBB domain